jgi:hypothetical protein
MTFFQIKLYQVIRLGLKADYFDIGMGHLVHILSPRTGVSFDQLAKDRILNVLAMDSTSICIIRMNGSEIILPEDIKQIQFAKGNIPSKEVKFELIAKAIQSAGAMYSIANYMLNYLSANTGLIQTEIKDSMQETHS